MGSVGSQILATTRALSMGLYREDKWKNSKGNESSLKFNEEETGDRPLVRKQAVTTRGRPGPAHKGANGLCSSRSHLRSSSQPPHQLQQLQVTGVRQRGAQEPLFRPGLPHWRRLSNPIYSPAAPDEVQFAKSPTQSPRSHYLGSTGVLHPPQARQDWDPSGRAGPSSAASPLQPALLS